MMVMKFSFVPQNFFRFFFQDQDQDFTIKINNRSYGLCFKDTDQIWYRSAKFFLNHNPVQDQDQEQDHDFTSDFNTRPAFYT